MNQQNQWNDRRQDYGRRREQWDTDARRRTNRQDSGNSGWTDSGNMYRRRGYEGRDYGQRSYGDNYADRRRTSYGTQGGSYYDDDYRDRDYGNQGYGSQYGQ